MINKIIILILFPVICLSQPINFKDYKVRSWHAEFSWTAQSGAVAYEMYMNDSFHGKVSGTTYVAANLNENSNYFFKVRSVFSNGSKSPFTYEINVRTGLYPAERTAFSTIPFVNPSVPVNREGSINTFGLYQQPVTNDAGFPRGNASDYWDYPRLAAFASDGSFLKSQSLVWNTSDLNRNTVESGKTWGRYLSTNPLTPKRSYGSGSGRTFRRYDDGVQTFSKVFTSFNSASTLLPTAEDNTSYRGRLWAFQDTQGEGNKIIVYDSENDVILREFDTGVDVKDGWISISPLENYLVVARQYFSVDGSPNFFDIYTIEGSSVTFLRRDTINFGHADLGVSMQGNEVVVFRNSGRISMLKLTDGSIINLLGGPTSPNFYSLGHVSCKNFLQPGWAYMNNNDTGDYNSRPASPNIFRDSYRKAIAVKLDENTTGYGNTLIREYGIVKSGSEPEKGTVRPSGDGSMIAVNSLDNGSGVKIGVFYQQRNLIGDEIPFGYGPNCPPCEDVPPGPDPEPQPGTSKGFNRNILLTLD